MEDVRGRRIFEGLADEREMEEFTEMISALRINRRQALFPPKLYERNARTATAMRLANWNAIALRKGTLDKEGVINSSRHLLNMTLTGIDDMEFTHGHLTSEDVIVTDKGERVIFSPSFWSYRPKHYESTFQIWAALKGLKGGDILSPEEGIAHCEQWKRVLMQNPVIHEDLSFREYFASNMRERAIGALMLDIDQNHEGEDKQRQKELFRGILRYYS